MTNSVGSVLSAFGGTCFNYHYDTRFLDLFPLMVINLPMLERTILKRDKLNISGLITNLNETISRYISGYQSMHLLSGVWLYRL